jgi:hypothetical protein
MKILILCCIPIIILIEILLVNLIFEQLETPSDIKLFTGSMLIPLFAFLNFMLLRFYSKHFKRDNKRNLSQ